MGGQYTRIINYLTFPNTPQDLTEREKCAHIISLNEQKPNSRNKLRITRPYQSVQADLQTIHTKAVDSPASTAPAESNIEQRWYTTYDHFLPDTMRPPRFKINGIVWDSHVVAALDVLSSLTHGQARLAQEVLIEAVKLRLEEEEDASLVVQCQDVVNAVGIVYERAGVLPARLTKARTAKMREKEKKKALREKKKAEARRGSSGVGW